MYVNKSNLKFYQVTLKDYYDKTIYKICTLKNTIKYI